MSVYEKPDSTLVALTALYDRVGHAVADLYDRIGHTVFLRIIMGTLMIAAAALGSYFYSVDNMATVVAMAIFACACAFVGCWPWSTDDIPTIED